MACCHRVPSENNPFDRGQFICDICGLRTDDEKIIEEHRKIGLPKTLFKIGDVVEVFKVVLTFSHSLTLYPKKKEKWKVGMIFFERSEEYTFLSRAPFRPRKIHDVVYLVWIGKDGIAGQYGMHVSEEEILLMKEGDSKKLLEAHLITEVKMGFWQRMKTAITHVKAGIAQVLE